MLSIIIPVLNQHKMTEICLDLVEKHTPKGSYEIILIDNGSSPPAWEGLKRRGELIIIHNTSNLGFPMAVNQGIKAAKGDVICLLNNDVFVSSTWTKMLDYLKDGVGIVGPMTGYASGIQKILLPLYESDEELEERAIDFHRSNPHAIREVNWVIGFCMMITREVIDKVGPLDESGWPCCGEEVDFCLRARQKGFRIGIARDIYVHHQGSVTFRETHSTNEYNALCRKNSDYLYKKWGRYVQSQLAMPVPENVQGSGELRLNLGCGMKKIDGYVNIDNREECRPDLVLDVTKGLPYDDNSVSEVKAADFLEHITIGKTVAVIEEIYRVLKPGGLFEHFTPSTDGRGAFQDPNHVSFWNENSWLYFMADEYRELYGIKAKFKGDNQTVLSNALLKIYHVHGVLYADK